MIYYKIFSSPLNRSTASLDIHIGVQPFNVMFTHTFLFCDEQTPQNLVLVPIIPHFLGNGEFSWVCGEHHGQLLSMATSALFDCIFLVQNILTCSYHAVATNLTTDGKYFHLDLKFQSNIRAVDTLISKHSGWDLFNVAVQINYLKACFRIARSSNSESHSEKFVSQASISC